MFNEQGLDIVYTPGGKHPNRTELLSLVCYFAH